MNIEKSVFYIGLIWYFYTYGPPPFIHYFLTQIYFLLDDSFITFNRMMNPDFWEESINSSSDSLPETIEENKEKPKLEVKYEDKFLDNIRQLKKEWQFTDDEIIEKNNLERDFLNSSIENIKNRIKEITNIIVELNKEIENDTDGINYIENVNEYGDELLQETTLEERNEYRKEQINELQDEESKLKNQIISEEEIIKLKSDAEKQATDYIIKNRVDKLTNSYVMEKTPQGNVLMIYDKERESFKYYSDSTMPYRYLEVVGRKYVKMFNCRPLFIDMEEELKLFEEKWTKEYELKKAKEAEERLRVEEAVKNNTPIEQKKNVFAKFKNYNKDAGGKISMAAPPKNSIPNKPIETKEDEKLLLKERANRYTYEGKFANFNFLQKIEKKVFNKKLGISFADFKKMKQT